MAHLEKKAEAVLIAKRHKRHYAYIQIESYIITDIKYLEVIIDLKLIYRQQVQYVCGKASIASILLSKMKPNVGGGHGIPLGCL